MFIFSNVWKRIFKKIEELNLSPAAPKEGASVNETSATDWQMVARRDNLINERINGRE